MAISTIHTALMKGTGSGTLSWSKLICISEFPDLGASPEQIDVTTLCDEMRHYIPGVQDTGSLEFKAFYTASDYSTLKALAGTDGNYAVWFGANGSNEPDGHNGKFSFKGDLRVTVDGGGVNDPVTMTITIFPSTDITFAAS